MSSDNSRELPRELVEAEDNFTYIHPHLPKLEPFFYAELSRPGRLVRQFEAPGGELQFKEFDFGVPFGPRGWNYFYFKLTLQRAVGQGGKATGLFFLDLASRSYGRYSGAAPFNYDIVLLNGDSALRRISLAADFIPECHSDHRRSYQTRLPDIDELQGFPLAFYNSVDNVRLEAFGNQESCNSSNP